MISYSSLTIDSKPVVMMWVDGKLAYALSADSLSSVNAEAYADLSGAVSAEVCAGYTVYDTFDNPPFTDEGTGQMRPFVVSPHVVATAAHYGTFPSSVSISGTAYQVTSWHNLSSYDSRLSDMQCGVLSTPVPSDIAPYFMTPLGMKKRFWSNSLVGVVAYNSVQDFNYALPQFITGMDDYITWSSAYANREKLEADLSAKIEAMGPEYAIKSGDSGKPLYMIFESKPIVISHNHLATSSGTQKVKGPNYIAGFDAIERFVTEHGDTLKVID